LKSVLVTLETVEGIGLFEHKLGCLLGILFQQRKGLLEFVVLNETNQFAVKRLIVVGVNFENYKKKNTTRKRKVSAKVYTQKEKGGGGVI
jgi:hypothetical protein